MQDIDRRHIVGEPRLQRASSNVANSNLNADNAFDAVFGYTAANDISRAISRNSTDNGSAARVSTPSVDPQQLTIETRVDGEVVQCGYTRDVIFSIVDLICYCSRYFTLHPGHLVLSGTPAGCGDFRTPRRGLRPGSIVEVGVEGIGVQCNRVIAPW